MTRDEILDAIWGTDFVAESNVVDRHIRSLRVKLQDDYRQPRFIATVPRPGLPLHPHLLEPRLGRRRRTRPAVVTDPLPPSDNQAECPQSTTPVDYRARTRVILSEHRIEPGKPYWRNQRRDPARWPGSQATE